MGEMMNLRVPGVGLAPHLASLDLRADNAVDTLFDVAHASSRHLSLAGRLAALLPFGSERTERPMARPSSQGAPARGHAARCAGPVAEA